MIYNIDHHNKTLIFGNLNTPLTEGNGRIARLMMNAELLGSEESRVIIPTVYRNNYILALMALSRSGNAKPLIRTLDFAQKYVQAIDWANFESSQHMLERTHAFDELNLREFA